MPSLKSICARELAPRSKPSNYPPGFAARVAGREKRVLGDPFGLQSFGVNLVRLPPGSVSALHHRHRRQDEFIYVLSGNPTVITDDGEEKLESGRCIGFRAGGTAHHLENRESVDALYLEVGDRQPGDAGEYPRDDLVATLAPDGTWVFTRKDGTPF
jgi:uncharacterized cupin superfamily protein